jgi:hypothetical protein
MLVTKYHFLKLIYDTIFTLLHKHKLDVAVRILPFWHSKSSQCRLRMHSRVCYFDANLGHILVPCVLYLKLIQKISLELN